MIKVKTQTRFMVLFTSVSLLTCGEISRCLAWHLPQVFACYLLLTTISLHFYRHFTMTEYAFFAEKADRWGKDMASLWGNLNICPLLYWLELPCHSQAELFSIRSLKVWGNIQKPCCNIAYLLVWVENTMKDRHYGISLVWVNPNQVRAATMEEAVEKLTVCTSSGTNWPYTLVQLYKGPHHVPLPKGKHLGILPWERQRKPPVGRSANSRSVNSLPLAHKLSIP